MRSIQVIRLRLLEDGAECCEDSASDRDTARTTEQQRAGDTSGAPEFDYRGIHTVRKGCASMFIENHIHIAHSFHWLSSYEIPTFGNYPRN